MNTEAVDILIVGGGPVGAALALALEGSGHSVVLAEARGAQPGEARGNSVIRAAGDARAIALSYGSSLILERLHAFAGLAVTPIETIHISQRGGFGRILIRAADCGLPALGYVANYDDLQLGLLAPQCSARRLFGARLSGFDGATAVLQTQEGTAAFSPRLTVLADGAHGTEHDEAPAFSKDYHQSAVVAWVNTARTDRGRAWERFTPEGPLALLPHAGGYALVWTTGATRARHLCALDTATFLSELHTAFGDRLGAFSGGNEPAAFALTLRYQRDETRARVLRVGNAAQTLHPVAGQGFNLGLRDAWELARHARDNAARLGDDDFTAAYRRSRALDRRAGIRFTDGLVGVFSNSNPLLAFARGAGLLAFDLLPPAREFIARRMIFGARALP